MKKRGMVRIVFGFILVAFQILGMIGNALSQGTIIPPHPVSGYTFSYLLGYFLIGIIGIILLCFGFNARANSQNQNNNNSL